MVSARPIVSGDGPREDPTPTPAVRNSRLATLSARDIVAGDILPRGDGPSPRRDGGLGITIDPVGVEDADCLGGKAGVMSPTSENKSPSKKKLQLTVGAGDKDKFSTVALNSSTLALMGAPPLLRGFISTRKIISMIKKIKIIPIVIHSLYEFVFQLNIFKSITFSRERMSAFHKTTTNNVNTYVERSNPSIETNVNAAEDATGMIVIDENILNCLMFTERTLEI
ncbi:hypothetical protein ALC53_03127 [Atta colombica]|uniref:Uncharacterized protein n=1 Tax=Atta colombica TaxID=520822 RepID=A0A195BR77_9HYME|nr:hypothetical protein ALC53_03127 [Atta colombica]